ncbi:MAG: hypothetical protein JWS08_19755 [Phormidium sp. PBR-2020]|nr:MAG: hypothetical protein JWS08_19755 [Phormidium sp. PBR-2020]
MVGSPVSSERGGKPTQAALAASTPLRGEGVWLPLHGAMVGSDSLAG